MNTDNISSLYNNLIKKGYSPEDIGDENTFREKMASKENRRKLYDYVISRNDFRIGDYDNYEKRLSNNKQIIKTSQNFKPEEENNNRKTLRQQVNKNEFQAGYSPYISMTPLQTEEESMFPGSQTLGKRIKEIVSSGKLDTYFNKEEEKKLDKTFNNRDVQRPEDVIKNYTDRFALTKRGNELNNELNDIQREIADKYANEFIESDVYNSLKNKYSGEKLNIEANKAFDKAYQDKIEEDMQPYYDAYQQELYNRYQGNIENDIKKLTKSQIDSDVDRLSQSINMQLEDVNKNLSIRGGQGNNAINAIMGSVNYNNTSSSERKKRGELEAAQNLLDESKNIIEEAKKKGNTNFIYGLGRGFSNKAFDPENWAFGLSELRDSKVLIDVLDKYDNGKQLTKSEQALMDAAVANMATNAYYYSDLGRGYKAGMTTAQSIPFMLEFAINPVSASGSSIAKSILRYGMKKFGKEVAKKGLSKFTARLAGDALAAAGMSATTGAARVAAGTIERQKGDIQLDDTGRGYAGRTGQQTSGEALTKSAMSTFLENQSEMVFNAFKGLGPAVWANVEKAIPGGVSALMDNALLGKAGEIYRKIKSNPTLVEAAKRTQFHGLAEEYLEEVYNNFANIPLGEMTLEEATDLDNNIDTFLGLAPTSAAFGLLGIGGYAREQYRHRRKMQDALGQMTRTEREKLSKLEEISAQKGNEDIKRFIKETIASTDLTPEEKKAEIAYAYDIAVNNAMQDISNEQEKEIADNNNAAIMEGQAIYAEHDPAKMRQTVLRREIARERLAAAGMSEKDINTLTLGNMNAESRNEFLQMYDENIRNAATDYLNALDRETALNDALDDAHEGEVTEARQKANDITLPNGTVTVVPLGRYATDTAQFGVVVNGIDANGMPTQTNSALMVYPIQADANGEPIFSTIDYDNAMTIVPESYTDAMVFSPTEAFEGMLSDYSADAAILSEIQIAPQAQFDIMMDDGSIQPVTVMGNNGAGAWIVSTPEGKVLNPIAEEELEKRKRNAEIAPIMQEYDAAEQIEQQAKEEAIKTQYSKEVRALQPQPSDDIVVNGRTAKIKEVAPDGLIIDYINDEGDIIGTDQVPVEAYYQYKQNLNDAAAQQTQVQEPTTEKNKTPEKKQNEQPLEIIQDYPRDKNGEPMFSEMSATDTINLLQTTLEDDATSFAADKLEEAKKNAEKAAKKSAKKTSFVERTKELKEIKRERENADKELAYWQDIYNRMMPAQQKSPADLKPENKTKENRQTGEEAEVQTKLQKKINSEVYNKPVYRKKSRYVQEDMALGEANSPQEFILREISTGRVTFIWKDTKGGKGLGSHLGVKDSEEERRRLIWALNSEEGMIPEVASEAIYQDMPEGLQQLVTQQDVFNYIIEAFSDYGSPKKMFEAAKQIHGSENQQEIEGYEEDMERQYIEWEAEQNKMTVTEWIVYNDIIAEELEKSTASLTDDELNTIFEQIYEQLEQEENERRRIEEESARGTEQPTNNERGDNVLPEQETDTKGRAEEQPGTQQETGTDAQGAGMVSEQNGIEAETEQEKRYRIVPAQYTTKRGKVLDMQLVTFDRELSKDELTAARTLARELKGWYDRDQRGFMMRSEEDAIALVNDVNSANNQSKQDPLKPVYNYIDAFISNKPINANFEEMLRNMTDEQLIKVSSYLNSKKERTNRGKSAISDLKGNIQYEQDEREKAKDLEAAEVEGYKTSQDYFDGKDLTNFDIDSYINNKQIQLSQLEQNGRIGHAALIRGVIKYAEGLKERLSVQSSIEQARSEVETNPTEAQKEAGNYKKGHIKLDGYDVTIENPKGSERKGVDASGKAWSVTMNNDYGYIRGTKGVDGDHIDVFLSDNPESGNVYVVDQVNSDGTFDEHKVMYGFDSEEEARKAYLANYSPGWTGLGNITEVSKNDFKKWVESSHRKTKAFAEYASIRKNQLFTNSRQKITSVEEFMSEAENDYQNVPKPKEEDINDLKRLANNVLEKGKNKSDITTDEGYNELSASFEGIYPNEKKLLSKYSENRGVAWVDKEDKCVYRIQYDAPKYKNRPYIVTVIKEYFKEGNIQETTESQQPKKVSVESIIENLKKKGETKLSENVVQEQPSRPEYGANNKLVSTSRYEELKKKMRDKLNQLNAGFDPELFAIGAEMAAYHIEAGARKFEDYAKRMIMDMGDAIRPYLKSFYDGVKRFPGIDDSLLKEMTPYDELDKIDVNSITLNEDEQTEANTEAIASQAETIADNAESRIEEATNEEQVEQAQQDADRQLQEIDKQLEKLDYVDSLHSGMRVVLKDGRNVLLSIVMHSGEQIGAVQFSKPRIERLYASYKGQLIDFTPDEIDIDATISLNQPQEEKPQETETAAPAFETPVRREDKSYNGYKVGDKVIYTPSQRSGDATEATIHDFEAYGNHKPVLDTGLAPVLYEIADWSDIKPAGQEKTEKKTSKSGKKTVSSRKQTANLINDLFAPKQEETNLNNEQDGQKRGSEKPDSGMGKEIRPENGTADRPGMDKGSSRSTGIDQNGSRGNAGLPAGESTRSTTAEAAQGGIKNARNNHSERGTDYAPRSPKARFDANVKAIKLMRELMQKEAIPTREQMAVLRKYSGWGGMGTYFNNEDTQENKTLRELLTDEEYDAAVNSINSAYYTPAKVIDAMWDVAEKLGFKGGKILEGSAGIGNILGLMPQSISEQSNIEAVEIDSISGNILKLLYPDAKVHIQGFEETTVRNGSVDLAITNVPFVTGLSVYDNIDKDLSKKFRNIHDFCIAKNVRKLREGGIGIFISSNGTLDKSTALREWLVNEGASDVIGAFRLNNETFGGTNATSDIIVVRKRIGRNVSPQAIDVLSSTVAKVGTYNTGEKIWDKKTREWVPETKETTMEYNTYFQQHPENMGGEMFFGYEKGDTFRPGSYGLYPVKGKDQDKLLTQWTNTFIPVTDTTVIQTPEDTEEKETEEKEGTLFADDKGNFFVSEMGVAVPLPLNKNKVKGYEKTECLNDYKTLKDALDNVLDYQVKNQDDKGLEPLLKALNEAYDNFTGKYGSLNKNTSIAFLRNDVDFPAIAAIEDYREYKNAKEEKVVEITKTDVFNGRVIGFQAEPEPKTVKDGVIASIYKFGHIDLEYIAGKMQQTPDKIKEEILNDKIGFVNPVSGAVEVRYEYLSGNVREKLEQAKANNQNGEYNENIKALEEVLPMDIPAHLIDFSLGSSWIDPKIYIEYIESQYGVSDVKLNHVEGIWNMKVGSGEYNEKNRSAGVYSKEFEETTYGTELVEAALNNRTVVVKKTITHSDKTKETIVDKDATQACAARISEIKDEFKEWMRNKMLQDEELATKVMRTYNDKFNNMVPKTIDEMFLPEHFGGSSDKINLYTHQKRAVIRGTTEPLMLAHEVGSGKTFTLISTAMEMRRLGTAKKPMIVVQNATVAQFVNDAKKLYPNARVLTLTDKDRTPEGRRAFYGRIKYSDWDMIIIPQSTFEMIPDSPERQLTFIQERIDDKQHAIEVMQETGAEEMDIKRLEDELTDLAIEYNDLAKDLYESKKQGKKKDAKAQEKAKQKVIAKAKEQLDRRTDEVQYFDEMGIDAILIDEAHEYKRLGFSTAMTRGVKGIDPAGSKKAAGVYLKTRVVLEQNGWKNVIFATGTPISNTAAEIWTFMKYLMPKDMMKANDIYYFDDFVRNFGNITQSLEFATNGKFKENTRFAAYINKPELIRLWSTVSDTVLTKDISYVNDKIPALEKDKHQDVFLPQSESLISIMNAVREELDRFENMSGKEKRRNSHIPLTMYGIAKRAAIDARLVDANAADEPVSKTNKAVEETLKSLKETEEYKGTVAIFCDNQRRWDNGKVGFDLFEDIRSKLVAAGVPDNQIVIMKPGMSIPKKQKIFDDVNAGNVRVILGNTQTLGTGVNIQERLHTLIHMDAPDRPMDYTQRNGRILRQGNLHKIWNKPVRILRFGVEDSLDVTSYQRLKTKAAFIDSIMDGKTALANNQENRTLEEEEEGLFDNPVAILSGSQYALLKNAAEREYRKFLNKKNTYEADQIYVTNRLRRNNGLIAQNKQDIAENRTMLEKAQQLWPQGKPETVTVNGKVCKTDEDIAEAFKELVNKPINVRIEEIKKDAYFEKETIPVNIKLDNVEATINVLLLRRTEYDYKIKKFRVMTNRVITYDIPALDMQEIPVMGGYAKGALEDMLENVVNGSAFADAIESLERSIKSKQEENKLLEERKGRQFEFGKELDEAKAKVEEYTELMKQELKEKEAKYAGRGNATVNLADIEEEEQEDDVRFRIGDSKYLKDGRKILFTRQNPTKTFNSLIKWIKNTENTKLEDISIASTGSRYVTFIKDNVTYNVRSSNHTKGYYGEIENETGIDIIWGNEAIYEINIDLSENDLGINDLKEIIKIVNIINSDTKGEDYFINNGLYPSELYGKNKITNIFDIHIYNILKEQRETKYYKLKEEVKEKFPYQNFVASNGISIIHRGPYTPESVFPKNWKGKTKLPSENAINEYLNSNSYQKNKIIYEERINYINKALNDINNKLDKFNNSRFRIINEKKDINNISIDDVLYESQKLNLPIKIYMSINEVPEGSARRALEKGMHVKGWYQNGQINIFLPNATSMEDVKATLLHEGVAHYGLRKMVGDKGFNAFLDKVFAEASKEVRNEILRLAPKYKYNLREATEEYLATMAEQGIENPTFWDKVKQLFRKMLEAVGYRWEMTDKDLRYLLWESYNKLGQSNRPTDVAKETRARVKFGIGQFAREELQETRFRIGRFEDRPAIIQEYDNILKSGRYNFQEAFQDSMLSLKVLQNLIEKQSGKKARTFENAYLAENRLSSVNKIDNERYIENYFNPLIEEVKKLAGKYGRQEVEDYIYAKSGLERNEVLVRRDAQKKYDEKKKELDAKLENNEINENEYETLMGEVADEYDKTVTKGADYSGLEGLAFRDYEDELYDQLDEGTITENDFKAKEKEIKSKYKENAQRIVDEMEEKASEAEIEQLWNKINAATNETLNKLLESGMISAERHKDLMEMMRYYVPLRGWNEDIAEDVYNYTRKEVPVQKEKGAKGRKSLADNPIAQIALSAQSAIILGNRNKMKQRFFNFIINRPNELAVVGNVWYAHTYNTVHDQVERVYPEINETDDAETIMEKIDTFEKQMEEWQKEGRAYRSKLPLGVELKFKSGQKPEHMVSLMINGKEYVIYINGNPRAAQALNGKTNAEGEENLFWEYYNKLKRLYGGGLTSNNPDFVMANLVRDTIHSLTMEYMNQGFIVSARYLRNIPKSIKTVLRGLKGKYDSNNKMDVYFKEFINYGGETGYTAIHTIDDYKKDYNKMMKEVRGISNALSIGQKGLEAIIQWLETANRFAEDINRFNAYMSSRESGYSIEESINEAKNITVNFNKKGALNKGQGPWAAAAWFTNKWILFFNPAVQGIYQVTQSTIKNKKRVIRTLATIFLSGFLMPYLNQMLLLLFGGSDDEDYFNLTEYTRMNNWVLYTPAGYIKIPLPPFFREIYGLGDILHRVITGRTTPEKAAVSTVRQLQSAIGFINLIPEGEPSVKEAVSGIMPDLISPLMDIALNRDFTGRAIAKENEFTQHLPEYERIYKGVSPVYVEFSRMLNEIGGDDARRSPYFGTFINPAYMEHLVTSYTGGIGKTISNTTGMIADAVTGNTDNISIRTIPVLNRFLNPVTDRNVTAAINRVFYDYQERYEKSKLAEKRYKQFIANGRTEFNQQLKEMKDNGEIDFIKYFSKQNKILRKKQDQLRDNPNDKELEREIREIKSKMIMKSKELLR